MAGRRVLDLPSTRGLPQDPRCVAELTSGVLKAPGLPRTPEDQEQVSSTGERRLPSPARQIGMTVSDEQSRLEVGDPTPDPASYPYGPMNALRLGIPMGSTGVALTV